MTHHDDTDTVSVTAPDHGMPADAYHREMPFIYCDVPGCNWLPDDAPHVITVDDIPTGQTAHELTDSDKLDLILAEMQNIRALATQVLEQAAPVIESVSKSPVFKMFSGR